MKRVKNVDPNRPKSNVKVAEFFKKNIYYILMAVSVLAIGTIITVAAVLNTNKDIDPAISDNTIDTPQEDTPQGDNTIQDSPIEDKKDDVVDNPVEDIKQEEVFLISCPVDEYIVIKEFSDTQLVWNSTQMHWATHEGIDLKAAAGSNVKCVYDGVVKSVEEDSFNGVTIVITHIGGYESTYKLLENPKVKVGDKVKRGDVIASVSKTALAEVKDGEHVHFELSKDGVKINPIDFLIEGNK